MVKYGHQKVSTSLCHNNVELYDFISNLDKDALIADHPDYSDCILFFSKRKVFISLELTYPFYDTYYAQIKKRTYDFFDMYYSNSSSEIYNFCKENNVDYIIVYNKYFSQEYLSKNKFYFNPFNDYIKSIINENKNFVLTDSSKWNIIFSNDDVKVISCNSLN